jgi:hypothetical protein
MYLIIQWGCGLDEFGPGYGSVAGSCEHDIARTHARTHEGQYRKTMAKCDELLLPSESQYARHPSCCEALTGETDDGVSRAI